MRRARLLIVVTAFGLACGDHGDPDDGYRPPDDGAEPSEVDEEDAESTGALEDSGGLAEIPEPELSTELDPQAGPSDPLLDFVLLADGGTARLVRVNPNNGVVSTVATHLKGAPWQPIGVAHNKLLWQRSDNLQMQLWTLDANGGRVSERNYWPPAGWRARGLAFDQAGACPLPDAEDRTFTILLEGTQLPGMIQPPAPWLWHLNETGVVTSNESFPTRYPGAVLEDFRTDAHGFGALIYADSPFGSGMYIDWYGRDGAALERLRTDRYTAAGGFTGCTVRAQGVQCPIDFVDDIPGAGYRFTSLVATATVGGLQLTRTYALWSRSDGLSKIYPLGDGDLLAPSLPIATAHAKSTAVSLSGRTPQVCPLMDDAGPAPDWPSDPVVEIPGCPEC